MKQIGVKRCTMVAKTRSCLMNSRFSMPGKESPSIVKVNKWLYCIIFVKIILAKHVKCPLSFENVKPDQQYTQRITMMKRLKIVK